MLRRGQSAFQLARQLGLQGVSSDADRVGFGAEGILDLHVVFFGAEDDADGGLVARSAFGVVEEVQVEVHFARELRLEGAELQLEGHQCLEEAMVEEQVDEILLLSEHEPMLSSDKAEAVAEFQKEGLQAADEAVLQLTLPHRTTQAEELEVVGAFEHLLRLLGELLRQREVEVVRLFLGLWQLAWLEIEGAEEKEDASSEA